MEAKDTVVKECICASYDKVPFKPPHSEEVYHCYECDAYHDGKKDQAEVAFKAGEDKERERTIEFIDWLDNGTRSSESWRDEVRKLRQSLKEEE